jgi:flagellin
MRHGSRKLNERNIMISLNATGATSAVSYYLGQNNRNLQKSLTRLSSGYRINSAVDDPGGLAVSMKLSASLRRTDAVSANVGNALSFLQSQDGVLSVASSIVLRMSELATLATTESVSTNDTALYNAEFVELKADISSLLNEEFNGISLFAAGDQTLSVVTSENGNSASISKANLDDVNTPIAALTGISTVSLATTASAALETAIQSIASLRASNGGEQSRLTFAQDILAVNRVNLEAANSRIMDVDIAEESTNFARLKIVQEAGLAILAQANTSAESLLRLLD